MDGGWDVAVEALDGDTGRALREVLAGVRGKQRKIREDEYEDQEEFTLVRVDAVRRLRDGSAMAVLSVCLSLSLSLSLCKFGRNVRMYIEEECMYIHRC